MTSTASAAPMQAGPGGVPAFVLFLGPEEITAERGVQGVVDTLRQHEPEVQVMRLYAASYEPGALAVHASPSLFGGWTAIVVHDLDEADDALVDDLMQLIAAPAEEVTVLVRHKGGNRAKRVLDAIKAGGRVVAAKAIKTEADKHDFVLHEFREGGRKIERDAVSALVLAVGKDVRELAGACAQLMRDTTGLVTTEAVDTYYEGRVETTGFKVADAALAGDAGEALRLLRHAFDGGLDPVPVIAVLAMQLRQVGRVASAGRASAASLARDLALAPWQVEQARRKAAGWDSERLGRAIAAVAAADVEVKGGVRVPDAAVVARDPEYAVEQAVLTICRERGG